MTRTSTLDRPPERLAFKVAATDVVTDGTAEVREDEGVVTAIVSVTGTVDEVDDVIEPGAYVETLKKRKPKVCWHHSWEQPIGRVLHIEELMPGDSRLPSQTKDGRVWPKEAGALLATMQFNMKSERGREAFEAVRFYSESGECEWSIGYQVAQGKASRDSKGIRHIKAMDLYELSFVLFGAHMLTGTLGLKDAVAVMVEHKSRGHRTITAAQIVETLDALGIEAKSIVAAPADGPGTRAFVKALVDVGADPWYLHQATPAESKRDLNAEQRHRKPTLPGSDDRFPIGDRTDLRAAIQSYGRASDEDKPKIKRWIIRRARELDAVNLLPDSWNVTKSLVGSDADTGIEDVCPGCGDEVVFDTMNGWMRLDGSYSHEAGGGTHSDYMDPPAGFTHDPDGYYTTDDAPVTLTEAVLRTATESLQLKAGGTDRNRGEAEQLRRYWTVGEGGAKIRWNTDGDFTRCVRYLSEHMTPERAKGYCANRHREMTGMWPGDRDNKSHDYDQGGLEPPHGKAASAPGDTVDSGRLAPSDDSEPENTGVMVALYPDPETAEQIAVRGGTTPDDLHITLAYLGDIDDDAGMDGLTLGGSMDKIMAAAQAAASVHKPLAGSVGGIGKFPDSGDGVPIWTPVDVVGLGALRESVVTALTEAGLPVKTDHGFTPHMTLGYNLDMSLIPPVDDVDVTFDQVSIVVADARADVPIGAGAGTEGAGATPSGPAATPPPAAGTKAYEYDPALEVGPHAGDRSPFRREHKSFPHLEGTFEERQSRLEAALAESLIPEDGDDENPSRLHLQINGTWDDRVVATVHDWSGPHDDSTTYEVDYGITADGEVHLGEPNQVRLTITTEDDEDLDAGVAELMPLSELVETVAHAFKTLPTAEVKAGRVLSADHVVRLKAATEHLVAVLDAAGITVGDTHELRQPETVDDESTAPLAREAKHAEHTEHTEADVGAQDSYEVDTSNLDDLLGDIDALTR